MRLGAFLMLFALAFRVAGAEAERVLPAVTPLADAPGIHNLFRLGTNVFSGSTPEGDAAFAALATLGVKTIISVDGAKPDVDLARKYGIRYVHLPHGYDGIATNVQLQLARAGELLSGPVYVHCHHGKHRGPTAAALICLVKESWTPAQADQWLKVAGTATNYAGLYATVREFRRPSRELLERVPGDFPEVALVSGLVDAMVAIDEKWEHLKAVRATGYRAPSNHPDLDPANESVILWEQYRETQRLPEVQRKGRDFLRRLAAAEAEAQEIERLLRLFAAKPASDIRAQLDQSFEAMKKSCSSCHKAYRDQPEPLE